MVHGEPVEVERVAVDTLGEGGVLGVRGLPSVLVDGVDPFAEPGAPVALSCRRHRTPQRMEASPTVDQIAHEVHLTRGSRGSSA